MSIKKRELLFLYESKYSIPNGDPFTGEQRYDDETKKVLVSDVRIKRFIRDYLENNGELIFVSDSNIEKSDKSVKGESGASARYKAICKKLNIEETNPREVLEKVIDLRLFGGIVTAKRNNINFTGPVQFALLNPSLNKVNLRMHQNTTVFVSSTENKQGSIGTTTVVPYSINQIHGWVNPYSAEETKLQEADVVKMLDALWKSINLANTRSKSNQRSLLMLSVNYKSNNDKVYGLDDAIKFVSEVEEESVRSLEEAKLNFEKLHEIANSEKIEEIEFYTESKEIKEELEGKPKFKFVDYIS